MSIIRICTEKNIAFPSTSNITTFPFCLGFSDQSSIVLRPNRLYEGWDFNSGNYLFTTDTK